MQTVSIERSVKFDSGNVNVYLPQVCSIEGEWEKLTIEQPASKLPVQEPTKSTDVVDPLGSNFEHLPEIESHLKHVRQESAAIEHLWTGEGVQSSWPSERGQLPKGVQPGFIEEVAEDDEMAAVAAIAVAEMDEIEPSYEEACQRSDWPEWKRQ